MKPRDAPTPHPGPDAPPAARGTGLGGAGGRARAPGLRAREPHALRQPGVSRPEAGLGDLLEAPMLPSCLRMLTRLRACVRARRSVRGACERWRPRSGPTPRCASSTSPTTSSPPAISRASARSPPARPAPPRNRTPAGPPAGRSIPGAGGPAGVLFRAAERRSILGAADRSSTGTRASCGSCPAAARTRR